MIGSPTLAAVIVLFAIAGSVPVPQVPLLEPFSTPDPILSEDLTTDMPAQSLPPTAEAVGTTPVEGIGSTGPVAEISSVALDTTPIVGELSTILPMENNATTVAPISVTGPAGQENATGQRVDRSVFDCSTVEAGIHGNPKNSCDTKFYICVDPLVLAYEQPCPAKLFFDGELKMCESWIHIPGCSGKPRKPTPSTEAPSSTARPDFDCSKRTNGNYPDPIGSVKPFCSNRFFVCIGGSVHQLHCPTGLLYDKKTDRCERQDRIFECTGKESNATDAPIITQPPMTLPPVDFDCRGKATGFYAKTCSNEFYSCNGGQARRLNCPIGLIFDPDVHRCDLPSNSFICTGSTKAPTTMKPTTEASNVTMPSTTPSPMECMHVADGIYPDPLENCSRKFYFCAHNVSFQGDCPANLYYDVEHKRCDLWLNVFACSGMRPTAAPITTRTPPPSYPTLDFDCTRLENGNYANPKENCSQFFYMCASMDAFKQECPAGLFYDRIRNRCDSWQHIFECSGATPAPSTPSASTASLGTTKKPAFDCSMKLDGTYQNPINHCSHVYYQCVGGYTYDSECPANLFYDIELDRCEIEANVPACSGISHTPSRPSTTPNPTSPASSTDKPALDCAMMDDGDYADPINNCSKKYYTCASGFAFVRDCPPGTVYDSDLNQCNRAGDVPACTGKARLTTPAAPPTIRTPRPTYSFDCTKRYDGDYKAGECKQGFWSCIGGWTFPRSCSLGLIYDSEMNRCEFPFLVPECGGRRIESTVKPESTTPKPVTSFDCTKVGDGNFADPLAKDGCGDKFVVCANGIASLLPCPKGLFYDPIMDACNRPEEIKACGGKSIPESTTSAPSNATTEATIGVATSSVSGLETTPALESNVSTSVGTGAPMTTGAVVPESTSVLPAETTTVALEGTTPIALESSTASIMPDETSATGLLTTSIAGLETSSASELPISTVAVGESTSITSSDMVATTTVSPLLETSTSTAAANTTITTIASITTAAPSDTSAPELGTGSPPPPPTPAP